MPTDERIERWCQLLTAADSLFEFKLGLATGTSWKARPPYPNLKALGTKDVHVRRFVLQQLDLEVSVPEDDDVANIAVERLVAELEDGREVEIARTAKPATVQQSAIDNNVCPACDDQIVNMDDAQEHEGVLYHKRCMS